MKRISASGGLVWTEILVFFGLGGMLVLMSFWVCGMNIIPPKVVHRAAEREHLLEGRRDFVRLEAQPRLRPLGHRAIALRHHLAMQAHIFL